MADPSMMSLFGDDGHLFPNDLEGLGDCGYAPQTQANPMAPPVAHDQTYGQMTAGVHVSSQAVSAQPKIGPPPTHRYDHFSPYEQQQGTHMVSNGPINGMSSPQSRYHSTPAGSVPPAHHAYPVSQTDTRAQAFTDGNGNNWAPPQVLQVSDQAGPPFQQQATPSQHASSGPQAHGTHQMGAYMTHADYSMSGHGQSQQRVNRFPQSLPQEPNHFMGHVGVQPSSNIGGPPGAPSIPHPGQQPQRHPQQFLHRPALAGLRPENMPNPHGAQYPTSPSRHPPSQQVMAGRANPNVGFNIHSQPVTSNTVSISGQYPPYGPYGSINQGISSPSGMTPGMSLPTSSSYPNQGGLPQPQQQRYPPTQQGPMQQPALQQMNQTNAQTMHPGSSSSTAQQNKQQHLPPPQGAYGPNSSMSPLKSLSKSSDTPPRPSSTGLGSDIVSSGYSTNAAGSLPLSQRVPDMTHPQVYNSLSPNRRPQGRTPNHELPSQQGSTTDQRLQSQQLQSTSMPFQSSPPPLQQPWVPPQSPQSTPPRQKGPHIQRSPPGHPVEVATAIGPPSSVQGAPVPSQPGDTCDQQQTESHEPQKKKRRKSKVSKGDDGAPVGEKKPDAAMDPDAAQTKPTPKKKSKKPKEPKEPKEPGAPKTPKAPKEKVKTTTPKPKSSKKPSMKKADSDGAQGTKKEAKRKREPSATFETTEKTPPPSHDDEEEEEDDDGVQKRRSSRQVKRKRYTEEIEFKLSEDEDGDSTGPKSPSQASEQQAVPDAEGPIVEKIMGIRLTKTGEESEKEVEEFFVKFKNFSYLHCRWAPLEELEKDKRIHQKVKRFKAKQALSNFLSEMDDEPFNPDYVEVDRVLDVSESTDENGETVTLYLVKWCSLPYEDSTWELKTDVDPSKIEDFDRVMTREPDLTHVERPPASDWVKSDASRDYKNDNKLREYQLEGVNWLLFNWFNTRNCILADEMGLGKTIQSITFLYEIFLKGIHGPFLVIAPLSTIPNWEREFRTWTELNVVVYHGSQASRRTIQTYEMNYRDEQGKVIKGAYKFHAVITTFEMILTDCPELRNVQWRCVVIDEAHRLKNRNCKLLEGLKLMDMEHKVLLTGTPLQNTVEELFSLLNFLEPERFPSESTFMQEFGDLKTEEQVQKLQGILKPMMLRRLKEDVEKNLAPKEETIIEVELTNVQKKYYRAILERNFAFLSKSGAGGAGGGGGGSVPNLLNTMMELRKCCNHPYLINGAEEKILEEYRESHSAEQPDVQLQSMIHAAGKLVLIDKLLPKLKAGGHRVLIFSQMVRCLDILEDYLIQRRYPYERIDGRVRGNLRQAAIDRFSRPDSDRFVFLLCTRAGGLGINLTAADTCIIFDSDWNPQNDLQAQARCHRIGQSKAVKIYRLITRNSYEREMFDKASLKLGLDKAVLQSMSGRENAATGVQQLSKKEIEDLLRKGAYGALMDEEDEGSKFCEEDIDQILMRRTKTITIEAEGVGSTFAKASFVSSGNRTDISLEDPDFWQKWAKKAELDLDAIHGKNNLVIDTPRVRKQTRHFSAMKDDELMEYSDLESDSEDKPAVKPRRAQDRTQGFSRSECFRVEKNLLVYGWGRWRDILSHGRFKRQLTERDVETICRALLAYCLLHYRGDENIKSFVWDLITPTEDGQSRTFSNHSGLSTPVPRGRKGKKGKVQLTQTLKPMADWLADCNPEVLLQEESYKRHLKHHCNKVLLRVRMLYYLRQEVIGDHAERILSGVGASELDIWIPQPFTADVPADWWSSESDKSLLIGVFKHGYEKYNSMRADGSLSFLEHVGMPDPKAIAAEQRGADLMADGGEGEDEDPEYRPLRMTFKDEMDEFTNSPLDEKEEAAAVLENTTLENGTAGSLFWPQASALTARLRRLITAYQRTYKRENAKREALAKPDRRRRQRWSGQDYLISAVSREVGAYAGCPEVGGFLAEGDGSLVTKGSPFFVPEGTAIPPDMAGSFFKERRQRWTRREEADFYRIVSTFGVVYDVAQQRFDWSQFRAFARLDKKTDESLEKYYFSFVAMCKRVCRMQAKTDTELADPTLIIDPITEERASRTLYRIELLRRIREQVLPHPQLAERLRLCQASGDLPSWWECGRHDEELLRGAAKHGVSRTDYHILNDPHFSFLSKARGCSSSHQSPAGAVCTPNQQSSSGLAKDEKVVKVEEGCEEAVVCTSENVKEEQGTAEDVAALSPKAAKQDDDVTQEPEKGPDKDLMQHSEDEQSGPAKPDDKTPPGQSAENVPKVQETGDLVVEDLSTVCKEEEQPEKEEEEEEEEEDKEDKVKDDDKSEKSPQAEVGCSSDGKNMDEGSNTSLSTGRDEARDEFCADDMEGCPPQTLPDRPLIFAFWPKDRIMINRMDNICELVLKGKWPSSRRQLLDFPGVLPGYASTVMTDSPLRRRSLGDVAMTTFKGSGGLSASPAVCKDEALSLSEPRQRRRRRRKVEMEAERSARRRSLMEMVAQLRESHVATTDQNQHRAVVDLTKALHVLPASSSSTGLASSSASDTLTSQRLLGGRPRSLANGSLLDVDLPVQRRRGRRKNVEGLELLFLKNKRAAARAGDCERTNTTEDGSPATKQAQAKIKSVDTVTPGEQDEGEEGGPSSTKDLRAWLKDHPTYTMDMSSYGAKSADLLVPHGSKPKQKRHRCRNPNKIDINTLTGDERVPVVNKRNGRKMGGAMAPPMKDLPRWLMENPEYAVAPDWSEIVKQSGFLPESMFDCLLTGPVVREEGARRRGRRPKSEMAKASAPAQVAASAAAAAAAAATAAGVNPLLMNGLFGNMDLTSLQGLQNLQSLQLAAAAAAAGLMGFPQALTGSGDAKHSSSASASMLPLMLPAMGALPNMFNLSSLFGASATAPAVSPSGKNVDEQGATDGKTPPENHDDEANEGDDVKDNVEDCAENKDKAKTSVASDSETIGTNGEAALTAAAAAAASLSANPLAFNPFLLSSMAPGLFYPSMFLPPGLGGLSLPGFPTTSLADLQSAMNATLNTAAPSDDKQISPELSHTDQDEPPPATADTSSVVAEDSESEESQTADQEQDIGEQ